MKRVLPVVLIAAAPLLVACEPTAETRTEAAAETGAAEPAVDAAAIEQEIRDRVEAWERAANESPEAFASFYAEDGVLMAPNAPPATGPAQIAESMAPMFGAVENITFEPIQIDIAASGDLAVERGRYSLTGTMQDGSTFEDEGSYLVAWENRDGQWMVTNDIFNSDRPAPGEDGQ